MWRKNIEMPTKENVLPGRVTPIYEPGLHYVSGNSMSAPFPENMQTIAFGMGCFWGAERKFWGLNGVFVTAVGYGAGFTENPTYQEVCSGQTGHNELVLVVYDPEVISIAEILTCFWENHDPTQGMKQGNDVGTQYRSGIYYSNEEQLAEAKNALSTYQTKLEKAGFGKISTEILPLTKFYYAEEYHQQYLAKEPGGYCGLGGTGVNY